MIARSGMARAIWAANLGNRRSTAFSSPCRPRLDARGASSDQVGTFPELAPLASSLGLQGDEKAVLRLFPKFAAQIARAMPLRAIMTPRFTGHVKTTLAPVSRELLHRAAAFTTMSPLP